jgi:hypothetical protein
MNRLSLPNRNTNWSLGLHFTRFFCHSRRSITWTAERTSDTFDSQQRTAPSSGSSLIHGRPSSIHSQGLECVGCYLSAPLYASWHGSSPAGEAPLGNLVSRRRQQIARERQVSMKARCVHLWQACYTMLRHPVPHEKCLPPAQTGL